MNLVTKRKPLKKDPDPGHVGKGGGGELGKVKVVVSVEEGVGEGLLWILDAC